MTNEERLFLHALYSIITKNIDEPRKSFKDYNDYKSYIRKLYHDKYIIKEENIKKTYFKFFDQLLFTEGYGRYNLYEGTDLGERNFFNAETYRKDLINAIKREQADGIDIWFEYLLSQEASNIPVLARIWIFEGMLKIDPNNKNNRYKRRINNTSSPFVKLYPEVVNECLKIIKNRIDKSKKHIKPSDLIHSDTFEDLYWSLLTEKEKNKTISNEGIWIRYPHNDGGTKIQYIHPAYNKIHSTLKGYNTTWSIKTNKDICIYYTKDENNEYRIPRIIMYMNEENWIDEVRGIGENFQVEESLKSILKDKIKEFGHPGEYYLQERAQMQKVAEIYSDYKKRELTRDELLFIYDFKGIIYDCAYERDSRIEKIKRTRNRRNDLATIFKCTPEEIGLTKEDLYKHQLVYYDKSNIYDNMYIKIRARGFNLPKYVKLSVIIPRVKSGKGLVLPEYVKERLVLTGIENPEDLVLSKNVGELYLTNLEKGEGLKLPENAIRIELDNVESLKGIELPKSCKIISYHGKEYSLEEIKKMQLEEELHPENIKKQTKKYGCVPNWHYKRG